MAKTDAGNLTMPRTITRREWLAGLAAGAPGLLIAKKTAPPRLNVLFIASDDCNNVLGCYGHPLVRTPNIDRLAGRGVRFDRAYCQFPLCGPSRASILSGMRPDATRIWENQIAVRETMPDVVTLPQLFRNNGYLAARHGKMYHMDVPASVGTSKWDDPASWDVAVSPPGLENKTPGQGRNATPGHNQGNAMHWIAFRGDGNDQADDRAAQGAEEVVAANTAKPWFIGLGFLRPHVPLVAPERFFDLYPLDSIKPVENPANDRDDIPRASEITINTRANDMGMNYRDKQEALRGYYASISYMDSLVGRVLDRVDKTGQASRTVVVFWSDHGWHLGEHFRWQKRSLFEESARVPLIVAAPGAKGNGRASPALVELVDLYPSAAELCGLKPPSTLEGQSLAPLLDNPARPWKKAAFTQVAAPGGIVGRAVRTDRYRYIRWEGPHPDEELYDHRNDPREFTNLARDDARASDVRAMRAVLDAGWRAARAGP
ncbi:MAG: sulfatase [Bryobacteraceae bacterium]|nr:sulfatase [Bryobacteraceae bacterium]